MVVVEPVVLGVVGLEGRVLRRDLVVGSAALTVLLVVEAYIGGEIGANSSLTAVHIPLAMALMALSVWLPLRSAYRG